jgi:hypothetical protein
VSEAVKVHARYVAENTALAHRARAVGTPERLRVAIERHEPMPYFAPGRNEALAILRNQKHD